MNNLAKKFADILLKELSTKEKKDIQNYLEWFVELIFKNGDLNNILFSPAILTNFKLALIDKISKQYKAKLPQDAHQLIITLITSNKLKILQKICSEIDKNISSDEGKTQVKVIFAHKPDATQISNVESILSKKYKLNPDIFIHVDKSIVAGFIALFNGKMLDASMHDDFKEIGKIRFE